VELARLMGFREKFKRCGRSARSMSKLNPCSALMSILEAFVRLLVFSSLSESIIFVFCLYL
jgi:hypothetical protein